MDDVTRNPQDDPMPYGVDTIRLRISFPVAPEPQDYDDRVWWMRPLRGWTGGARWDAQRAEGEAAAPSALLVGDSDTVGALYSRMLDDGLVQEAQPAPGVQYAQRGPPRRPRSLGGPGERALSDPELFRLERYNVMRSQLQEINPENPELRKEYLTGPEGFVPTEADVDALYQALKDARSGRSPPQGPVNTPNNPRGPERGTTPNVPSLRNNEGLVPPDRQQEPRSAEPRPRGVIDESEARFKSKERRVAELLRDEGRYVKARPVAPNQRTADATVDGRLVEFKTPDSGATNSTIVNEVQSSIKKGGQARDIIVDARTSGLSEAEARLALDRISGVTRGKLDSVRIVGEGYDITGRYP